MTSVSPFDMKTLQDKAPPIGQHLSGIYMRSFAFKTLKDRLPIIITRIIDTLSRKKDSIIQQYGSNSSDELKQVIGDLSQLRSEIMTNKPLELLNLINNEKDNDLVKWNECIRSINKETGAPPTWYNSVWLFSECYMYRRISQIFALTQTLSTYDPYEEQKKDGFISFQHQISAIAKCAMNLVSNCENIPPNKLQEDFINLLKFSLWGNRCDLSLSNGAGVCVGKTASDPIEQLKMFDNDLLIDDSISVWNLLKRSNETINKDSIIDFIFDNAGYELFTDICLAVFLTAHNFTQKIRFYVKAIPWFISDTTRADFFWLIDMLTSSSDSYIQALGHKCKSYIESSRWTIEVESFWTEPYDFSEMKCQSPELYSKLSEAKLIIFKGDLNYRKLLGDINWKYDTELATALRGFKPASIVSLRTIKADLIAGLPLAKAKELSEHDQNWMTTGQYGLISAIIE